MQRIPLFLVKRIPEPGIAMVLPSESIFAPATVSVNCIAPAEVELSRGVEASPEFSASVSPLFQDHWNLYIWNFLLVVRIP